MNAPLESSFAKSLFAGRLPAAMVMPYPRLDRHEQRRVDTLIGNADPDAGSAGSAWRGQDASPEARRRTLVIALAQE
jgi:hypothetical protein